MAQKASILISWVYLAKTLIVYINYIFTVEIKPKFGYEKLYEYYFQIYQWNTKIEDRIFCKCNLFFKKNIFLRYVLISNSYDIPTIKVKSNMQIMECVYLFNDLGHLHSKGFFIWKSIVFWV